MQRCNCQAPQPPPPPSLCTDKGPAWITFKAIWQRLWGPSWYQALWEHWGSNLSWSCCAPTLSALQRLSKLAWQGELSAASFLQAALSLLPLRGGRHGNTEGLGRGSSEPQAPGIESRSLRQAHCQGHNTEGKGPQSPAAESRFDKPNWSQGVDKPPNSSNTPLCSGRGTPA